jgi:hypothetical protein
VEIVELKAVTTALGGSISVVDEARSTDRREVYKRIPVPVAIARAFRARHKISKYINPVITAVVYYDDLVIALERHPLGALGTAVSHNAEGERIVWTPECQKNLEEHVIKPIAEASDREWYFDGRYIYTFGRLTHTNAVYEGDYLTADGKFRSVVVNAIAVHQLQNAEKLAIQERTAVAFVAKNGQFAITPPIWKDVRSVGAKKTEEHTKDDDDETRSYTFDRINDHLKVNLNFSLQSAKVLSAIWGFEVIEALQLPSLMIRLKTVNLPNIPNEVKSTYATGMTFTHAFAWLMGYQRRVQNMDELLAVRSLFKYLTTTGIFYGRMFEHAAVYRAGKDETDVPMMTKDEAYANVQNLSSTQLLARIQERRENQRTRRGGGRERAVGNAVAGLLTEDD